MDIKERIAKLISDALLKASIDSSESITVEIPNTSLYGHYSSNIAMKLSSSLKKNPMEVAKSILKEIQDDCSISEIKIVKPGFINFYLSNKYLLSEISKIVNRKEQYLDFNQKKGKKIIIEYTDANPFKEFHIGHLYTNCVGEAYARLQEAIGAEVKRANYQGDVGLHVAKTLWGLEKKLEDDGVTFEQIEKLSLGQRVKYLGQAYVVGVEQYDEFKDEVARKEIDLINLYIFSLVSEQDIVLDGDFSKYEKRNLSEKYKKGRQWCLDYFEGIYEKLGTNFDYYFFESEVGEVGLDVVMSNLGSVFVEDEGSIVYKGDESRNLHTRVFVNKQGIPTYEAKELGLALRKSGLINFDESIIITGNEQKGYFKVVLDALSKIDKGITEKTVHISHGMVRLPGGEKMSSRKGDILSGEGLLEQVKRRIIAIMEDSDQVEYDKLDLVSEKIAIGAIKYSFLKITVGKDIVFDMDKSISFDGDTGPYLMYVYSRCNSILGEVTPESVSNVCVETCMENPFVKDLFVGLGRYREVLLDSALSYSPSTLSQYLFTLAQTFNSFYQNVRIIDAPEDQRGVLLTLVKATMIVMKDGLNKLGIDVVERM